MNGKPNLNPRKTAGVGSLKVLLATLGVTSTLGIWAFLSSRDLSGQSSPSLAPSAPNSNPPQVSASAFISSLPPIPTLAVTSLQPLPQAGVVLAPVQGSLPAPVASPTKIFLGGAQPANRLNNTTITSTRSSR